MSDLSKNAETFVDDPLVHSNKLLAEGLALEEADEYGKALVIFKKYRMYHPEDPKAYYELACCHYSLQDYDVAMNLVKLAISINAEYGEAWGLKGLILIEKMDYDNAIPPLQYSNVVMPNEEVIIHGLLIAYSQTGLCGSALICAKQLLAKKPLEVCYQIHEAVLYQRRGQYDDAIASMEKVVAANPAETQHMEMLNEIKELKTESEGCRYLGMNN
ncbi:MAG: tetratricopeptide repeat protein [Ignavibacteriales bacterium]|nr:tetratricopeptide repeat protein [Ignavibacteriales bacterium]